MLLLLGLFIVDLSTVRWATGGDLDYRRWRGRGNYNTGKSVLSSLRVLLMLGLFIVDLSTVRYWREPDHGRWRGEGEQ